jgi:WD40 repeat protein
MKKLFVIFVILIAFPRISIGQVNKKFSGNTDYVHSVAFSPGGKYLASGGFDGKIRIWDIKSGNMISTINIKKKIFKLYFDSEAKKILAGTEPLMGISATIDSFIVAYDVFTGNKEFIKIRSKSPNFFVQGYGDKLTTIVPELKYDSCEYIVDYNMEKDMEGKCYKLLLNNYSLSKKEFTGSTSPGMIADWSFNYPVAFSENGEYFVIYGKSKDEEIGYAGDISGSNGNKYPLYFFDVVNKKLVKRTVLIGGFLNQKNLLLTNDCSYFCYSDKQYFNDVIKILDINKDEDVRTLSGHSREILCLAIHPSEKFIASGSRDNNIIIWDFKTGKALKTLEGHSDNVNYITFSPDGKYLASASDDNNVILWDLSSLSKEISSYSEKYNIEKGNEKYNLEVKNEELIKNKK